MERNEMIEILMEKTKVTREEAKEALEKNNWDLLEAINYLEEIGKVENKETTTIIEMNTKEQEEKHEKKENNKKSEEKFGGLGEIIGKIFKFLGKVIKKGNSHFFEIRKTDEKSIRVSLTISVLLLIFLTMPSVVLLIVGLFCGYKYSIAGPNVNYDGVNNVFEEISKSADNIKSDFKQGYDS